MTFPLEKENPSPPALKKFWPFGLEFLPPPLLAGDPFHG
jgi:hypothetical protein